MSSPLAPRRLGLRFEAPLDLAGWKPLDLGPDLPLVSVPACPADGAALRTLCTFIGRDGIRAIRVGTCPACGHTSYIDRPTEAWFTEFYRDRWDSADRDTLEQEIRRRQEKLATLRRGVEREAVTLACGLSVDRSRPVCEIGCGYGWSLKQLEQAGFSRLLGIEASRHRAEVVRGALGVEVVTSPFEAPDTQAVLRTREPFSIIYSIHALEHTNHPDEVIAAASRLQGPGDYLIVSVPNLVGEPSVGVLFFLPHLHAFTRESLVRLAERHGYHLVDDATSDGRNLNMVFQRGEALRRLANVPADAFDRTVTKFVRGLALEESGLGRRRLWWLKRSDRAGQVWWSGLAALDAWRWTRLARRHAYDTPRAMLVSSLRRRYTEVEESPIEIQFPGAVTLFYK